MHLAISLLTALMLLMAIWLFGRTILVRLEAIKNTKYGLPRDSKFARLWRTPTEVVLQTRVIRQRPLVGLTHALVMWGFFVFAWATLNHLWFGLTGFSSTPPDHGWYAGFAATWAVLVLVGITSLAFRRFVMRPKALGKLSPTSGLVAGLIIVLMVTYLLGIGALPVATTAGKVNWWTHTAALCLILIVIPRSKHLHLLLAPLAIFFRAKMISRMRALDLDQEELGLTSFTDISAKGILDINACVECGRCTQACPINNSGQTLNPKEIILQMQRGLVKHGTQIAGSVEDVSSKNTWITEADLFQCLSCAACEQVCPVGIEHVGAAILDLRRGLVSEDRLNNAAAVKLFTTMGRSPHNPWGLPGDMRRTFIQEANLPIFDGGQEWLLWLGCGNSYDPHGQKVALAMQDILNASGISWGVLAEETCCGEPARRLGNEALFLELSAKLIDSFTQNRVRHIVTCCPHCVTMLDSDYRQLPDFGRLGIQVVHHSEFIANILPRLNIKPKPQTVTFHDSCYLARYRNITAEPRNILKACGVKIKEMKDHGKHTSCCGAGGGQIFIASEEIPEGRRVNDIRFAQALKTGAETIAVACPYCPLMLADAAASASSNMAVLDIAEIVAGRLKTREEGTSHD